MSEKQLIQLPGEERESAAVWRLLTGPMAATLVERFGLAWPACWFLLRAQLDPEALRLDRALEVDVIAGRISSEAGVLLMTQEERDRRSMLACANGRRRFAPEKNPLTIDFGYLVALEVKCAYAKGHDVRSGKGGSGLARRLRGKLEKLLSLGFDQIALLDITVGEPPSTDVPFVSNVVDSKHPRRHALGRRFPDLPVAQVGVDLAPEAGFLEDEGGSMRYTQIAPPCQNPFVAKPDVRATRNRLHAQLSRAFEDGNRGRESVSGIPVVLDLCPKCRRFGAYHGASECKQINDN